MSSLNEAGRLSPHEVILRQIADQAKKEAKKKERQEKEKERNEATLRDPKFIQREKRLEAQKEALRLRNRRFERGGLKSKIKGLEGELIRSNIQSKDELNPNIDSRESAAVSTQKLLRLFPAAYGSIKRTSKIRGKLKQARRSLSDTSNDSTQGSSSEGKPSPPVRKEPITPIRIAPTRYDDRGDIIGTQSPVFGRKKQGLTSRKFKGLGLTRKVLFGGRDRRIRTDERGWQRGDRLLRRYSTQQGDSDGGQLTGANENFCDWRQEFLMEMGEKRRNNIIEPMRGKNKIICMPNDPDKMSEDYLYETTNNSSIFAKATPPLKRRTTPMSDIVLSKQPGKGSAENVRDVMARLFLGDRRNHYPNYDLSGHKSDGSDTDSSRVKNESYDDSGFRQPSMSIGEGPTKEGTRTKSTAKVLAAMAALNANNPPLKKKKKKKKDKV